jgi:hypothetical protein
MRTMILPEKPRRAPMENGTVILKRTFDQSDFRGGFYSNWRIIGPENHPRLFSDIGFRHTDSNGTITFVNPLNGGKW